MKTKKIISMLVPAAIFFAACSENTAKNNSEVSDGSKMLQGVTASIFDMPSSIANGSATVDIEQSVSLAKVANAALGETEEEKSLGFYAAVPATIHFADAIKDSVRLLIEKLAAEDLPEVYEGPWGDYTVKLLSVDSLGAGEEGKLFRLSISKEGEIVMHLQYRKNNRDEYRGACYFRSEGADSTQLLLRFNTFNEATLGKRMTIWITRPTSSLENPSDPTVFRFRAVQTPAGRIMISGVSYHPEFDGDDFWLDGAKVYGFRAISDVAKDQAILRVAFADADSVDGNFFVKHGLDKAVLNRASEIWKKAMIENDTIARAVVYSMDEKVRLSEIITSPRLVIDAWNHQASKPIEEFTAQDLEAYLDINAIDILAGNDEGMKILYFHVKVKQPIFLSRQATIVGYESKLPKDFALESSDLDAAEIDMEDPENLDAAEITAEDVESEESVENL